MSELFQKHEQLLRSACNAVAERGYWSAYPESPSPKVYGEAAKGHAEQEFARLRGRRFDLPGHPSTLWIGAEQSPYGESIDITYPTTDIPALVESSHAARAGWAAAGIEDRVGVCLEILDALNKQSYLIAHACRITTGQPFVMAFQSGGPHAQERGLEAVAHAYQAMTQAPRSARWEKPQGKGDPLRVEKTFTVIPRGISVAVGCATFPTWNSYGGMFASLATGNSVIIKPHPLSIMPLAITARIAREVLAQAGFDPNVVLLAVDTSERPVTKELVMHPEVAIVDFTGSSEFGAWLRGNARHALVYTEEAGVNSLIIDSTTDFRGMCQNIAFSLSLYSGQMCTAPQNLFIPQAGISTNEGHKTFTDVADAISGAVRAMSSDPAKAEAILGAIQNETTIARVAQVANEGPVLLRSVRFELPSLPNARTATPLLRLARPADKRFFLQERFGPIAYLVATDSTAQSIELAEAGARQKGAITMGVYSTTQAVIAQAQAAARRAGVSLSCNLTGGLFVNQNAAFSDYHVTGANAAGNACLTDAAFVANRFRVIACRTQAA